MFKRIKSVIETKIALIKDGKLQGFNVNDLQEEKQAPNSPPFLSQRKYRQKQQTTATTRSQEM